MESIQNESVLVIGAGIAGLKAAYDLEEQGYNVQIVEASDRIGGRVYTHRTNEGYHVEIGGNWLHHHAEHHPLQELMNKVNALVKTNDERLVLTPSSLELTLQDSRIYRDGSSSSLHASKEGLAALALYTHYDEYYGEYCSNPEAADLTLSDYVDSMIDGKVAGFFLNADVRNSVRKLMKSMLSDGAPSDRRPMAYNETEIYDQDAYNAHFDNEGHIPELDYEKEFFISHGVEKLLKPLRGQYEVKLGAKVTLIEEVAEDKMRVHYFQDGQEYIWAGDKVICTIPLGVLKRTPDEGGVRFSPELSSKKEQAIQSLAMKNLRKLILTFDKDAFDQADLKESALMFTDNGQAVTVLNVNKLSGASSTENPSLIVWIMGDDAFEADAIYKEGSEELKSNMLKLISGYYPSLNIDALTNYIDKAWGQDQNTYGSYSYVPTYDGYQQMYEMAKPEFSGKLIFAGEHTNPTHEATMHGAYQSGLRAANQVFAQKK